jgi:hypothetical protein
VRARQELDLLLRIGIRRRTDRVRRRGEVVFRSPELDVGPEQRPVRARLSFVRHADAPRVDDADVVDHAIELMVRVTADDGALRDLGQDLPQALVRRDCGDRLEVAARGAVAEERAAEPVDLECGRRGPGLGERMLLRRQLRH